MKNEKKYYRAIYRKLPLRRTEKKQYLSGLLASLNEYVAEKPEITYQELVDTFGTPDSVVAGILNVSVDETRRMAQNKRKLYVLLMVAMLAVCLILCFATCCISYTNSLIDSYISVQKIWQIQKYYRKILTKYRNNSTF